MPISRGGCKQGSHWQAMGAHRREAWLEASGACTVCDLPPAEQRALGMGTARCGCCSRRA